MRSRLILIIAIVAMVVGTVGAFDFFQNKPQTTSNEEVVSQVGDKYVAVWKLKRAYEKGQAIETQDVLKQQIPIAQALSIGIREDVKISFSPIVLLNRSLDIGDVILPEYQLAPGQDGYIELLVSEGMTLYPLEISDKNLINDYIGPGSYIDILSISSPNDNLAGDLDKPKRFKGLRASMFLKKVKVLNVGDNKQESSSITAKSPSKKDGLTTIVIEVKPGDITRLALAQRTMHLEIYKSYSHTQSDYAEVRNIIDNYTGIDELRGNVTTPREAF